ncbi:MAG: hypothetical protein H0V80_06400 [Acidobacteria bacterium]|nr:hypothetical protein [Acidobacteriota bacterium]
MRFVVLAFSVLATACTGTAPSSPTAPSSMAFGTGATEARRGSQLPIRGNLVATETVAGAFHRLTGSGEATHLGRFTVVSEFNVIPPPLSTASGTAVWSAANGDNLFTTTTGQAVIAFPLATIVETHTITGGTGRFESTTGSILVKRSLSLTTLQSSASLTGTMNLGH